ncbi:patatin-like phospholipase family protein [Endothiovibrio diazotrophicus]
MLRVLSMDGGGVYGMFTDLMLKQLVANTDGFLDENNVQLFAGTSAGSINACILAMHERPADGIEQAARFWAEPGVYANSNPVNLWLTSLMGITPFFGTEDYRAVLVKYFGDRTLGDLRHPVLVVTWDWAGENVGPGGERQWAPRVYCNFPDDNPDRNCKLADVGFKAGAPSWFRCIYEGGQDGGLIAPNPALYAITRVVEAVSRARASEDAAKRLPPGFQRIVAPGCEHENKHYGVLKHVSVLSLGVGARQPFLPVSYANWGAQQWMSGAWNPYTHHWVSPMTSIGLDGPTDAVNKQCDALLNVYGREPGFFRLNPRVLETPVMDALLRLRANPWYLQYIEREIRDGVGKPAAQTAIAEAERWLIQTGWAQANAGRSAA